MSQAALQGYSLSPQQTRCWQLQERDTHCFVQCALLLEGNLNSDLLRTALSSVIDDHEILRTTFKTAPGMKLPVQVISEIGRYSWREVEEFTEAEIDGLLNEEGARRFDYREGPLIRAAAARLDADKHVLVVTIAAMCADTCTLGQLVCRVLELYESNACASATASPLQPIQYADFAEWQNQLLSESDAEGAKEYWRRNGAAPELERLPFEKKSGDETAFVHNSVDWTFDQSLTGAINKAAGLHSTTSEVFLFACWQVLIWRLTDSPEITIGWTCQARESDEMEVSMGPFSKTLPIRHHPENLKFSEVLRLADGAIREAASWQEYFDIRHVETSESPAGIQLGFEFYAWPAPHRVGSLKASLLCRDISIEPHKLNLTFIDCDDELKSRLAYDARLFERSAAESISRRFSVLVKSALTADDPLASALDLLDAAERVQLLADFSRTEGSAPPQVSMLSIHEMFEVRAAAAPDAIGVCCKETQLSYRMINRRGNQCARHLKRSGIGPEAAIGIFLDRGPEIVIALLAALKAGGAFVVLDTDYPDARLAHLIEETKPQAVLTNERLANHLPCFEGSSICFDRDRNLLELESDSNSASSVCAAGLAYVAYTSGSTGKPKGILSTHGGVANYLRYVNATYFLNDSDTVLQLASFTFDASVRDSIGPLTAGAKVIVPTAEEARDPAALLDLIERNAVTRMLAIVPTTLRNLVSAAREIGRTCDSVQTILLSGEPLYTADCVNAREVFGAAVFIVNQYGPTECTMTSTYHAVTNNDNEPGPVLIGGPIPNSRLFVLGSGLDLSPPGIKGEIQIGGVGLARGYMNRPDLTAERFIPDPLGVEPGARVYNTGDLAYYTTARNVSLAGRKDHQVKIRGVRVEPGEIEAVLGRHPSIREVAVVAKDDGPEKALVAYYTPARAYAPRPAELRAFLREHLPEFLLPSAFVELRAMPLTRNGKVNRAMLREDSASSARPRYVAPRTPVEETMADIWADLLRVERPGVDDNFFDLGGHSLRATTLVYRVLQVFQVELPLRGIFDFPTLGEFCRLIGREAEGREGGTTAQQPICRRRDRGRAPLSFAQQRLWFLDQLEPGSAAYNLPVMVRVQGVLSTPALAISFSELVHRHESLRTRFATVEAQPFQIIDDGSMVDFAVADLRMLASHEGALAAIRLACEEAARPFDLSEGPLFKIRLFRSGEAEHLLLISMHHIISDLWSTGILVRELSAIYASVCRGEPVMLAEPAIQYADFAAWQRDWLRGEVMESQLEYWTRLLGGVEPLSLPTDRPRPPIQSYRGSREGLTLPAVTVEKLSALARTEGATLYMVLLAAFQVLLHRYSNCDDIVVGSPSANRNHGQIEDVVGFFANTLVMRTEAGGNPSFRELIRRVKTMALGAYEHQDMPFEKLVEALQPKRDLSRNPLFQVLFALQNVPVETISLPGIKLEPIGIPAATSRFDLALWLVENPSGLSGSLEYSTDLFDRETAAAMLSHFQNLTASIASDPDQRIAGLTLLSEAERNMQVFDWNHLQASVHPRKSIHQMFEEAAVQLEDSTAVICEERFLTFGELNRRANQLANHLGKLGVEPGRRVGICLERSNELILAMLGVLKTGGAYVPLDPAYPEQRLAQLITDSRAAVVIGDERSGALLTTVEARFVRLDADWAVIGRESSLPSGVPSDPDQPAYVIFTSGSSGRPKGVTVSHASVVSLVNATDSLFNEPQKDTWTLFHSYAFDLSVWEIWRCLLGGSRLIVVADWMTRSPAAFYGLLQEERVTVLNQTPSALRHLINASEESRNQSATSDHDLALRLLFCGGEALPGELAGKSLEWNVPVLNLYGPTEATVWASIHRVDAGNATQPLTPIGRPLPNTNIFLLDQGQELVPAGVVGEICIGGRGVAQGYLNQPVLTADKFIPDQFSAVPGSRLYRTGDIARRKDATIEYLRRIDHQIKIRGYRVETGEIEASLVRHPGIADCVVTISEGRAGEKQLVAYIVNKPAQSPTTAELRGYLKGLLPDYMIPSGFITLETMPLTPNGKIDWRSLPASSNSNVRQAEMAPPRTFYEAVLAGIWAGVLGVDDIGIHDNFFDLGGHSLLAPSIILKAQTLLRVSVPVRSLFEFPTIAGLARAVEDAKRVKSADKKWTPVVELQHGNSALPFFCVHAGGGGVGCYLDLVRHLGSEQTFYGIQAPEHGDLEGSPYNFNSVEDTASYYLEAVREAQPLGPYLLGGWSAGGVIAFEMARQLKNQGQEVALLALLDCMPRSIMASKLDPGAMAFLYAKAMAASSGRDLAVSFDSIRELEMRDALSLLVAELKRAGIIPFETKADWFEKLLEGVQSRSQSLTRYSPRIYAGKITLFRGTEIDAEFIKAQNALDEAAIDYRDRTNGWFRLSTEQVDVYETPGHHYTIVLEPHVRVLARQLKSCIDAALKMTSAAD